MMMLMMMNMIKLRTPLLLFLSFW